MPDVLPKNCKKKQCCFAGKDASPCLSYLFLGGSKNYRSSTEGCQILKLHAPLYDTNPNFIHYFSGKALTFTIDFCINFDLFQKWVTFLAPGKDRWLASHSHETLVNSWPLTIRHRTWEWRSPSTGLLFVGSPGKISGFFRVRKSPESWHLSITTSTATLSGMEAKGSTT